MLSSQTVYPLMDAWLQALGAVPHRTARAAVSAVLAALLVGQSLRPSVLVRALPDPVARPARTGYRRVARGWACRWLTAAALTAVLVRAALTLTGGPPAPVLVLDSVRCGQWEVFTIGLLWHGRVLPLSWAVLPYPWPTGRFTPTVCALVRRVAAAWPAGAAAPQLLADRAFPSKPLFATLAAVGWGFTVRLRASDTVTVRGHYGSVRDLLTRAQAGTWTVHIGGFGDQHLPVATRVVLGRGLPVLRWHQRDAASARHRAWRRQRHLHDAKQQHRVAPTDPWVVLLTTQPTWRAAVTAYGRRYATEGTYRDLQTGWDGRHGWDLKERVRQVPADHPGRVEGLLGLAALGVLVQSWVGHHLSDRDTLPTVRGEVQSWTVHGRLSVWARGRLAFTDATGRLHPWLLQTLADGVRRLRTATATATTTTTTTATPPPARVRHQAA
jgi:hypothetical protein